MESRQVSQQQVQRGPQGQEQAQSIDLAAGMVMQLAVQPGCRLWVAAGRVTVLGPPRWLGARVWWP